MTRSGVHLHGDRDEYRIAWERYDEYYWNADSSQVILFATTFWEDGWYWHANYYNCSDACAYDD
jgi:hypothetical protein